MKPLSANQKEFLYRHFAYGSLRWIAKPVYHGWLGLLLLWHRIEDVFVAPDQGDTSDLTAVIKTFERPYAIKRLIKSIRRRYPELSILVIDDSKNPEPLEGVAYVVMPYDVGISAGRNHALDLIETTYFLLLDDDFVFSHRQQLSAYLHIMRQHNGIDIMGGLAVDLPFYITHKFQDVRPAFPKLDMPHPVGSEIGTCKVVFKVQNYFIGRTDSVSTVKWNPALKVFEHTDFFSRAYGKLTTVFNQNMRILHAKTPFDVAYNRYRYRSR